MEFSDRGQPSLDDRVPRSLRSHSPDPQSIARRPASLAPDPPPQDWHHPRDGSQLGALPTSSRSYPEHVGFLRSVGGVDHKGRRSSRGSPYDQGGSQLQAKGGLRELPLQSQGHLEVSELTAQPGEPLSG